MCQHVGLHGSFGVGGHYQGVVSIFCVCVGVDRLVCEVHVSSREKGAGGLSVEQMLGWSVGLMLFVLLVSSGWSCHLMTSL